MVKPELELHRLFLRTLIGAPGVHQSTTDYVVAIMGKTIF